MTQSEATMAAFEGRVRQLILRFQELKKENEELYAMIGKNEQDIKMLQARLTQSENDYKSLKMAKMIEISDGDLQESKNKIAKLIREVNKCIAVLSNEK
jgi:archaellum component FlaC